VRRVVILGTDHHYQRGVLHPGVSAAIRVTPAEIENFKSVVLALCDEHHVSAIAEEMTLESLGQRNDENGEIITASVPARVAVARRMPHQYSDATDAIRKARGIQVCGDIKVMIDLREITPREGAVQWRAELAKRENYWLEQITAFNCWPLLFVCGANHSIYFADLLVAQGVDAEVAYRDWPHIPKTKKMNPISRSRP